MLSDSLGLMTVLISTRGVALSLKINFWCQDYHQLRVQMKGIFWAIQRAHIGERRYRHFESTGYAFVEEGHEVHLKLVLESLRRRSCMLSFLVLVMQIERKERVKIKTSRGMILASPEVRRLSNCERTFAERATRSESTDGEGRKIKFVLYGSIWVLLIGDRDGRFTSRCWQTVQRALGTRLDMSAQCVYPHSQRQGQRLSATSVQTLEDMLRACVIDFGEEKLKAARDRQKSYADNRRKPLEFEVGDRVLLKVSPWKGVIRFGKRGKLAPRYVGPFEILERIRPVALSSKIATEGVE
ncbi:hypothetical protein Tco_0833325 [Tanacetum coccineum]